ncbi:reverse transcriptase domain-containing protein [Tanacetum coccineum]
MTWHATGKYTKPGKMQHPVDGRAWKKFDTNYPNFAKEPRNVRLGFAADGFNPFGNLSQAYSMWPDIDVYLRPLIDDLKVLWALKGVETIDVATGQKFNMRAMVLWTINDFPARSSLSGWSGHGYKGCPTCNKDTPCVRVLGKTTYVGHRRFLKKPHKWRTSLEFNGEKKDGDPPRKFDRDQIQAQLTRLPTRVKGLKSHDCHITMESLLPYGLQQDLPDEVAKLITELCSFFKQICSTTLMEDDMLKAQSKVVDILCNLELIYPPAFFDIMIYLVIHLLLEALEGGPIRP